jgi:hypothetical protein
VVTSLFVSQSFCITLGRSCYNPPQLELEHFFGLAYLLIGEEKHTGTQDTARGSSRARLAAGVRDWLVKWGYPWLEREGVICVDPLTHSQ